MIKNKLKSKRGETLVEILIALLLIALATGLFAAMYSAATRIDLAAREQDEALLDAIGSLENEIATGGESATDGTTGSLHYEPVGEPGLSGSASDVNVEVFTRDGMTAYTDGEGSGS